MLAGHGRPGLRFRGPEFGGVDGVVGVDAADVGRAAGREDISIGEDGEVEVRTGVGHRLGLFPGGGGGGHVEDVGVRGGGDAAAIVLGGER